ncbi:hypothetical protein [Streptomyces sp. NPDC049744]|uniref:hypothetical protein n=1 Tax=Streptomyces sp. NPDC049744 TaxID=3154359 RepID=UPI0034435040
MTLEMGEVTGTLSIVKSVPAVLWKVRLMSDPVDPEEKKQWRREQKKKSYARARERKNGRNVPLMRLAKKPEYQLTPADLRRREQKRQSYARARERESGKNVPLRLAERKPDDQLTPAEQRRRQQGKEAAKRARERESGKNVPLRRSAKKPDVQLTPAELRKREQKKQYAARRRARDKVGNFPLGRAVARATEEAGWAGVPGVGQVEGYLPEIAAAAIYEDYRAMFPQWPEVPPPGLKVAVDSATMDYMKEAVYGAMSGQMLGQGPAMATLNVPGAQAGPVTTADVPGFLADPGMDLTDPASEQFRRSAGITDPQYKQAAALQEGFLQQQDPLSPLAEDMPYADDSYLLEAFGTYVPPLPGQPPSPSPEYGSFDALQWEQVPALTPSAAAPSAPHPTAVSPFGPAPGPAPLHDTAAHTGIPALAAPHNPIAEHATQWLPIRNTPPTATTTPPTHTTHPTAHAKGKQRSRR